MFAFLAWAGQVLVAACGSNNQEGGFDAGVPHAMTDAAEAATGVDAGAEAAPLDAGIGMVGVLGQACSPPGTLGCAGNEQKLQLLCDATEHWVDNGTCSGSQLCDSVPGQNAGTCQDQVPQCVGHTPGYEFCVPSGGPELLACGPDLVTTTTVTICPVACANGMCVACEPGYWQCNGNQPQQCDPSGSTYAWRNVGAVCTTSCGSVNCQNQGQTCCE